MVRFFRGFEGILQARTVNRRCGAVTLWKVSLIFLSLMAAGGGATAAAAAAAATGGAHAEGAHAEWNDFQVILWQPETPAAYATAKRLGVTAAAIVSNGLHGPLIADAPRATLKALGLKWYDENIATDFYAAYHRWTPGKPVNWLFRATQQAALREAALPPLQQDALVRTPSLEDAAARRQAFERLTRVVIADRGGRPLFYNLSDEAGIADLAAYWDFDFSMPSLTAFRGWLRHTYPSLSALNAAWGRDFKTWRSVRPATTAEMLAANPDRLGAWLDFRRWMDLSFAGALSAGTAAVHAADGQALAGLEGAQAPGWGGYDYTALASAVDVIEVSGAGNAAEIAAAMNPRLIELSTLYEGSRPADLWRTVLHGGRGVVLWDDTASLVHADGTAAPRGERLRPAFQRLRTGLGAALIATTAVPSPVAVHYSPDSFRVRWLLGLRGQGPQALAAAIPADAPFTPFTLLRQETIASLRRSGLQPGFLSPAMIAEGDVSPAATPVIVLPDSVVLSDREITGLRRYLAAGGSIIAEGTPGLYDEHGRQRAQSPLSGPRLYNLDADATRLAATLHTLGIQARTTVSPAPDEIIERHTGTVGVIAWLPTAAGRQTVTLPHPGFAYDLYHGTPLGSGSTFTVTAEADEPVILAVSATPLPRLAVQARRHGATIAVTLSHQKWSPAATQVYRLSPLDADGNVMAGNVMAENARTVVSQTPVTRLAMAWNARIAALRIVDQLSGEIVSLPIAP